LEFGANKQSSLWVWIGFTNLHIPNSAKVIGAHVQFKVDKKG
jgi:hypothetical protein